MHIGHAIHEWMEACAQLAAIEQSEHPDIVDRHGRVWVWWKGELYRHCGMAWTESMVRDPRNGLPTESARNNPNYDLCSTCKGETDAS